MFGCGVWSAGYVCGTWCPEVQPVKVMPNCLCKLTEPCLLYKQTYFYTSVVLNIATVAA